MFQVDSTETFIVQGGFINTQPTVDETPFKFPLTGGQWELHLSVSMTEVTGDRDCPFFWPCHVYPDHTAGSSPLDNDNDNNGIAVLPVAQCAAT